jgi:hypothetical protein
VQQLRSLLGAGGCVEPSPQATPHIRCERQREAAPRGLSLLAAPGSRAAILLPLRERERR